MENQLRRGAAFCRRVAAIVLVLGFAGSMVVGLALNPGSGNGPSLATVLGVVLVWALGVLLCVVLFLMVARVMEGVAHLVAQADRSAGGTAEASAAGAETEAGPEATGGAGVDRPTSLEGAVEQIRMGAWVKVTTPDGWTGWVRDSERPPLAPTSLPRTAAGATYRPPGPFLTPGRAAGSPQEEDRPQSCPPNPARDRTP